MRRSFFGQVFFQLYPKVPGKSKLLGVIVRIEGGEIFSLTLRRVLSEYHGVAVGKYSYGALLKPGMADQHTVIGSYVSIGPGVRRFGAAHPVNSLSMHPFWYNSSLGLVPPSADVRRSRCVIGDDCWIGAQSVILPGCTEIGQGAVIGAGSVVTKSVPAFAIVAGNPAKEIGQRLSDAQRRFLVSKDAWSRSPRDLQDLLQSFEPPIA